MLHGLLTTIIILVLAGPALAKPATVVNVGDGDTFTVEWEDGSRNRVRLFGVDCPETKVKGKWETQPYGRKATEYAKTLFQKNGPKVSIFEMGESYGRVVGAVIQLESGRTVQEELVGAGLAWVDPRFCKNSIKECKNWEEQQEEATAAGRGLWNATNPIAPWDWRRGGRDTEDFLDLIDQNAREIMGL